MKLYSLLLGAICAAALVGGIGCSSNKPQDVASKNDVTPPPTLQRPDANSTPPTEVPKTEPNAHEAQPAQPPTAKPSSETPSANAEAPKSENSKSEPNPGKSDVSSTPSQPQAPNPEQDQASKAERDLAKKIESKVDQIQSPFAPNPKAAQGWKKSNLKPGELAKKVDQAMAGLKGVYGEASLYVKNKELEGNNSANFKIKDRTTYSIQYQLPDNPTVLNRLIADGKKKAVWEQGKWLSQQSEDAGLSAFKSSFTKKIFLPLTVGSQEWTKVVSDLTSGKNGYQTVVEEKQMAAGGRTFHYIRIVAKKGNESTLEARFDAKRFVPLTVRLTQKDKSGFESQYQWQAKWSFDNQFPASDFVIAKNPSEKERLGP